MATHTMKAVVTQHVSIVKDWQDCPVVKCSKCCRWVRASEGQYHCPLCPVSVYPPSTRDRLLRHLQEHQRDGVTCGDWHILQCHMTCGGVTKPHFHCLYCSEVRVEREEVQRHISDCASSRQGSKQECTQVTSEAKVRLDTTKVTSSDSRIRGHLTVKHKVEREAPGEDQVNGSPTKTLPTVSPGESPTKRRRGRPPSVTKMAGRRVGRPPGKQQDAGEDSSLDMGKQLTDLLDRKMREDGQQDGEVEGTREEEEVFPVLAGVVPQMVLAVLPGSLAVSLRKVAQQSAVKWRKVNNGYMMHGHWSDMMTARTHIQQMLKNARSSQSKTSSRAPRRITKSSRQEENDTMQGESEMMDSSTVKVDRGATLPTDPGRTGEGVKEEAEGEYCGQDQDKSEDYEDITIDEATTEVKREPKGRSLQTRTRRGLHNRIIFKNPEQASRTCIECGYQSTVEGIKKHRARRHASVEHECAVCGMKFGIRYDMRRHRMTHFDVHGNMLPDAVTLLKSFQPDASPTSLSHWETSFVPEGSANDVAKSQDEIKNIQELLDFRNDDSAQSGDKDVLEKEQSISSDNIGSPGDLPLGCPWCSVTCFNINDLHQHCNNKHLKWSLLCPVCDQQCASREDLSDHCSEAHAGADVPLTDDKSLSAVCHLCQFKGNVSDMTSHMTTSHTVMFHCRLCDQPLVAKDDLSRHRDEHLAAGTLPGSGMGSEKKPRLGRKPVKKPLRLPKEYLKFTCEICGRKLEGRASYSVHMKTHRVKPLLQCDQCDFSCYKPGLYNQHYRRKHCDERHPCSLCGTVCASEANLKFHLQSVHRQGPSSVCEQCGKVFSTRRFLQVHVRRVHRAEKRYFCKVCDKGFFERVRMTEHEEVHKEGAAREHLKNFTCSFCGKRFLRQAHMLQHENTHTGRKPFQCKVCGKAFCYNAEVRKHMAVHSDLRPHRCTHCGKGFKFRYKLTYHMTLHTKESKHRCNDCGKVFTVNTTLKKHRCKGRTAGSWNTGQELTQHVLHIIVPDEQDTDDVKSQLATLMPQDWASQMEMKPEGVAVEMVEGVTDGMVEEVTESVTQDEAVNGAGVVYMCGVCSMMFSDQDLVNTHMLEHGTTAEVLVEQQQVSESQACDMSHLQPDMMSEAETDITACMQGTVILQEPETQGDVVSQMYVIAHSEPEVMSGQVLSTAEAMTAVDGDVQVEVVTLQPVDDTDLETAATALTHLAR